MPTAYGVTLARLAGLLLRMIGGDSRGPYKTRPLVAGANGAVFLIEGRTYLPYSERPVCRFKVPGPSYFLTVGMMLLKGRDL